MQRTGGGSASPGWVTPRPRRGFAGSPQGIGRGNGVRSKKKEREALELSPSGFELDPIARAQQPPAQPPAAVPTPTPSNGAGRPMVGELLVERNLVSSSQ